MPRQKSTESYDREILKVKLQLTKTQHRYDALAALLTQLQEKKNQQEAKQIMDAFRKSNRSLKELIIFLDA